MYKFTNGIVVFDKETRDRYIKSGMVLIPNEEDAKDVRDRFRSESDEVWGHDIQNSSDESEGDVNTQTAVAEDGSDDSRWLGDNNSKTSKQKRRVSKE